MKNNQEWVKEKHDEMTGPGEQLYSEDQRNPLTIDDGCLFLIDNHVLYVDSVCVEA